MPKKKLRKKLQKKKQKLSPLNLWSNQISEYKFHKVGIIKKVEFGKSIGTMFGMYGHMMDGPFGLQLSIIEERTGFPNHWTVPVEECKKFFYEMNISEQEELIGKPVLCLSNTEVMNYIEEIIPHKMLLKVWEDE